MVDPRRSAGRSAPPELVTRAAERLLDAVMVDPGRTGRTAQALLASAKAAPASEAQSIVERVIGLALRAADDVAGAAVRLRRSAALADSAGLPVRAAESRMSLALVLDDLGRPESAMVEIDRAVAALTGLPRARARMQRAIILRRLGREEEALTAYAAALAAFRRHGDRLWQARALTNRGVLLGYRGRLRAADAELGRAEAIYADLGQDTAVAQVRHNRGFVAARGGDIPTALAWYDRADDHFRRHGRPAVAVLDRAELLLAARLGPEAEQATELAVQACLRSRQFSLLPQAQLRRGQAALAAGDLLGARAAALIARRAFRRQHRPRWAALADYVVWQATTAARPPTPTRLAAALTLARTLAGAGWDVPAMEVRLHAAAVCVGIPTPAAWSTGGRPGIAPGAKADVGYRAGADVALLSPRGLGPAARRPVMAQPSALRAAAVRVMADLAEAVVARPGGPARPRIQVWYGRALLRLYEGDRVGATRALRTGLRVADAYQDALGATELRVHRSAEGDPLAALGLRLALAGGRPREVLAWAERWRATALRPDPTGARPPALTADLAQLRRVVADLSTMEEDAPALAARRRRQRRLEDAVRRGVWRAAGGRRGPAGFSVEALVAVAAPAALVELVELDGALTALVVVDGRVHHRALAASGPVAAEAAALAFARHRMALRHGGPQSLAAARAAAGHAAARLDELLLAPIAGLIGDRDLVIVPTGALHALAWPLLPSCRGRPLAVAPSAGLWLAAVRAASVSTRDDQLLLVAAPDPPHAAAEVAAIARLRPGARVRTGAEASVTQVLADLDRAQVAHLAAHGVFRADNPLFSHLSFVDGPLSGYDLMQVRRIPGLVILSACDAGRSAVYAGHELMGLAVTLLGQGTRSLIASVGPVDDAATAELMVDLHRRLRAGAGPAAALAAAQAAAAVDSSYGFLCFGAG